VTAEKG